MFAEKLITMSKESTQTTFYDSSGALNPQYNQITPLIQRKRFFATNKLPNSIKRMRRGAPHIKFSHGKPRWCIVCLAIVISQHGTDFMKGHNTRYKFERCYASLFISTDYPFSESIKIKNIVYKHPVYTVYILRSPNVQSRNIVLIFMELLK